MHFVRIPYENGFTNIHIRYCIISNLVLGYFLQILKFRLIFNYTQFHERIITFLELITNYSIGESRTT